MLRFIYNYPALFISEEKALVMADLHIGIEHEIYKSGISIPSQIERIQKTISKLIKQARAKKLIIVGDVKHKISGISYQEIKEIPEFLRALSRKVQVLIAKGNHDSGIEEISPGEVKVYGTGGFKLGKYGFLHGHAWMSKELLDCEHLIIAHSHPALGFEALPLRSGGAPFISSGFRNVEYCWLKCDIDRKKIKERYKIKTNLKQAVVMPVFNPLISGMAFNRKDFKPLGPLLRNNVLKWKKAKVYLLDGTYLGRLDKL